MAAADIFDAAHDLKRDAEDLLRRFTRSHHDAVYAELRFEAVALRSGAATDGEPRDSIESESASFSIAVHARDRSGAVGHGQTGAEAGALAAKPAKLRTVLRSGLDQAYARARASARE
ncbi:MAG: hypothetical protein WA836_05600, partial [Candidatus Binataceae bacterium]